MHTNPDSVVAGAGSSSAPPAVPGERAGWVCADSWLCGAQCWCGWLPHGQYHTFLAPSVAPVGLEAWEAHASAPLPLTNSSPQPHPPPEHSAPPLGMIPHRYIHQTKL